MTLDLTIKFTISYKTQETKSWALHLETLLVSTKFVKAIINFISEKM